MRRQIPQASLFIHDGGKDVRPPNKRAKHHNHSVLAFGYS